MTTMNFVVINWWFLMLFIISYIVFLFLWSTFFTFCEVGFTKNKKKNPQKNQIKIQSFLHNHTVLTCFKVFLSLLFSFKHISSSDRYHLRIIIKKTTQHVSHQHNNFHSRVPNKNKKKRDWKEFLQYNNQVNKYISFY